MVDARLVQYVKARLAEGYTPANIRSALLQEGHESADVDAALHNAAHHGGGKTLLPVLLFLLIVAGVIAYFALNQPSGLPNTTTPPPAQNDTGSSTSSDVPAGDIVSLAAQLRSESATREAIDLYHDTVDAVASKAGSVADGVLLCSVNKDAQYKNYCLEEAAAIQKNAEYCTLISETRSRDNCYLNIILAGEDQYCSKLLLPENQRVCQALRGEL